MVRKIFAVAILLGLATVIGNPLKALAQVQATNNPVGVPTAKNGTLKQVFWVYNATTKRYVALSINVQIPGKGKAGNANETDAQASQRKAQAVADAMNTAIAGAIVGNKLPAGTAMVTVGTQPAMVGAVNLFGVPIDKNGFTIPPSPGPQLMVNNPIVGYGILQLPVGNTLVASPNNRDTTGEPRAAGPGMPAGGGGGGNMPSTGSMRGTGSSGSGYSISSGEDDSGAQSEVSFGLLMPQGLNTDCSIFSTAADPNDFADLSSVPDASSCPGDDIVTIDPTAGETDAEVLGSLASLFNTDFSSQGLSATFDLPTDALTLDDPIYGPNMIYTLNTDTGLVLDTELVPEPSSFALFGAGLLGLGLIARKRR